MTIKIRAAEAALARAKAAVADAGPAEGRSMAARVIATRVAFAAAYDVACLVGALSPLGMAASAAAEASMDARWA